jgi:serine/threonine protein kinase
VVDFGVAKSTLPGRDETEPGMVKGKFLYFSPEQACAEPLDCRTDVFATGVVLYRMLCGRLPFNGEAQKVMQAIVAGDRRPPSRVNPQLPSSLVRILEKAMAGEKEDRFSSALEMQVALSSFLNRSRPTFSTQNVRQWMQTFEDESAHERGGLTSSAIPAAPKRLPWSVVLCGSAVLGLLALVVVMIAMNPEGGWRRSCCSAEVTSLPLELSNALQRNHEDEDRVRRPY